MKNDEKKRLSDAELERVVGGQGYVYFVDDGHTRRLIASDQPLSADAARTYINSRGEGSGLLYMECPDDLPGGWSNVQKECQFAYGDCTYTQINALTKKR